MASSPTRGKEPIIARRYHVLIEFDPDENVWVTYVPALDMLSTYGDTREEALAMTEEAISGYLEVTAHEGLPLPAEPESVELIQLEIVA